MATKAKESAIRKDKKVTPSISGTRQQGSSVAKSVTSASTGKEKPNPSAKPTPSYLRPTLSSRTEPAVKRQVKKPTSSDDAAKAQLLRRRSFDRPPSASRSQQTFTSPDPKRPGSRDKTSTRSSSFSSSRITTPKPALERNSMSFKPVKSQAPLPATRTISRNSSFSKSNERSRNASGAKVPSSSETETLVPESKQERNDETSSIPEPEEMEHVESEGQSVISESEEENKKHPDDVNSVEFINAEDEKLQDVDHNISEEQSVSPAVEINEAETELQVESDENQQKEEENQRNITESTNIVDHQETTIATEDDHDKKEENGNENTDVSTAELQEEKEAEDIQVDEQPVQEENKTTTEEELKPEEAQKAVEERTEEQKPAEAISSAPKPKGGQGKKDSPAAYNDVIEETKNKLMEKRKNKVKALVGAFETVIDYETAASK